MSTARRSILFGGGASPALVYNDEFISTIAAPIPAGSADGRGYRVINDAESLMSIGSGVLSVPAQVSAVWGDEYYRAQPNSGQTYWTRPSGKALVAVVDFRHSTRAEQIIGWWSAATLDAANKLGLYTLSTNLRSVSGGLGVSDSQGYSTLTDYLGVAVWDSTGFSVYVKIAGIWHLKWRRYEVVTQAYCGMTNFNSTGSLKYFRIYAIDESLFAPALSIANPSVGNLADMPDGDFLLYLDNITRPSAGSISLRSRKKDTSNYWGEGIASGGGFTLDEVVATAVTNRISAGGVVSTDDLITIFRAQNIQSWRNTTALGSAYTTAYNFLRDKLLQLFDLGTGGAIANLYAWKARLLDETGLGAELVTNGSFTGNANGWTLGTGWAYDTNNVSKVAGVQSNLQQDCLTVGKYYELSFTVSNYVAGTLSPFIGFGSPVVPVSANGTYTYKSVCTTNGILVLQGNSLFVGTVDTVSCKEITFTADALALLLDGLAA